MEKRVRNELVAMIDRAVALARREGFDWGRISRLLGITRQWERERFKASPPRLPPHVVARNRYLAEQREGERLLNRLNSGAGHLPDEDEDVVAW